MKETFRLSRIFGFYSILIVFILLSSSLNLEAQSNIIIGSASSVTVQDGDYFYDDGFNNNYKKNKNYTITFNVPSGSSIDVVFESFSVEVQSNCNYDWLKIFDGSSVSSTLLGTYCGTNSPGTISSTGEALTFQWHSDNSVQYAGWKALIQVISASAPPVIVATGNQAYCQGDMPLIIAESISISDPDPGDTQLNAMSIQISSGYQNGEDLLSITGTHPNITSSWDVTSGRLTLTGPAAFTEFEAAILDVQYSNSSSLLTAGQRTFSITLEEANYLAESGHFYEFIPNIGIRWDAARDAAALRTYYGLQGYLATLSSQAESDLAGAQISGAGWLGGSDQNTEGVWMWMTGPEAGTVFWNGGVGGSSPNFAFWNTGEPNNVGSGGEDYVHITDNSIGIQGSWNDLPIAGGSGAYQPKGYVVEYGGVPGDPVLQISATTIINVGSVPSPVGIFHE
ncbi:hypothetical protein EO244_16405 [Ancylomarina salipaludis]|uniref:CUB domain-containing protein n=1 Tax=Ancylomarina salipaludis TaxID=2501299 RepID=A0A4Q1JI20_9BACT|nr:CUB domain-containing protein [Ancylomarina salipaludis]RXQ87502.1 hypothetical protein EO244_16405 [Ancylomarina salipaludis]